jgi:hypothetical protein
VFFYHQLIEEPAFVAGAQSPCHDLATVLSSSMIVNYELWFDFIHKETLQQYNGGKVLLAI